MTRRFWKWLTAFVAGAWVVGLGLQAIDLIPAVWVAVVTMPGMIAASFAPALWVERVKPVRKKRLLC